MKIYILLQSASANILNCYITAQFIISARDETIHIMVQMLKTTFFKCHP